MIPLDEELGRDLTQIRGDGLLRELRRIDSAQGLHIQIQGRPLLNFSSNDYLGLANDPLLKEAAICAVEKYGAGSGASRLISGSLAPHDELEETIAAFKGTEAALSFSTGYAAALGTICALLGKEDVIIIDKLVHASIVDAARLCGAKIRVFAHNSLNELEEILRWADRRKTSENSPSSDTPVATLPFRLRSRTLVVTESVFSMDGDFAPLRKIVELKERFGAWLMVDEAHATGLYGAHHRGIAEALDISGRVEIQMGTLGKAVGSSGGFIAGSRALIDVLINRARSFIFSTAPVPAAAAAALAGLQLIQSSEGQVRRQRLFGLIEQLESDLPHQRNMSEMRCPILPLLIGDENEATKTAAALREQGFFIPAIRYPTVARGKARLRLTVTAAHTPEAVAGLLAALDIPNRRSSAKPCTS
jgi:7-keto-8-aminopelargonate synthetase-like enzyme